MLLHRKGISSLSVTWPAIPEGRGSMVSPPFRVGKGKGKQRGKERVSKQKRLKGCHQGQNVTVLVF